MATHARKRRPDEPRSPWVRRVKRTLVWLFLLIGVPFIVGFLIFMNALRSAADLMPQLVAKMGETSTQPSQIWSRDGKLLYQVSPEFRLPLNDIKEVPTIVKNAMLAAEDRRFYDHRGVDPIALARTVFVDVRERSLSQGGSTLTMQLAKRITSKGEKTFSRKIQDIAVAMELEKYYTKDQILLLYLNEVYFGSGAYGIQAAAQVYFGKKLDKLTLGEAALVARLVRKPSEENPYSNLAKSVENRDTVLDTMLSEGMIDESQYEAAKQEQPKLMPRSFGSGARIFRAPYFVNEVLAQLKHDHPEIDLNKGGYRVETTLDTELQAAAEKAAVEVVKENTSKNVRTAAFLVMNKQGQILAEVGGVDYRKENYNAVMSDNLQPGSSFKPIVYATCFAEHTLRKSDSLSNDRLSVPDGMGGFWTPKNSENLYGGMMPIETAFKLSINLCAVRALETVGVPKVLEYARSVFGFKLEDHGIGESLALGACEVSPLEMAQAYSVFMTRGDRVAPYAIRDVVGPDKSITVSYGPKIVTGVLDPSVCDDIDDLMKAVVSSGTGTYAQRVPDARGKTGTTSDNKDAWFCGYTDGVIGIGWVGNEYRDSHGKKVKGAMRGIFGGNTTVKLWTAVMGLAQRKYGNRADAGPQPPTVVNPKDQVDNPDDPTLNPDNFEPAPDDSGKTDGPDGTMPALKPGVVANNPKDLPPSSDGNNSVPDAPPAPRASPRRNRTGDPRGPSPGRSGEDTVLVDICAESGLRANMYCPEVVTRRYRRGHEPTKVCTIHHG